MRQFWSHQTDLQCKILYIHPEFHVDFDFDIKNARLDRKSMLNLGFRFWLTDLKKYFTSTEKPEIPK